MKNIGIIGTRRRNTQTDYLKTKQVFLRHYENGDKIISGGCPKGGDRFAERIAKHYDIPIQIFYANWELGRHAGFLRNTDIAKASDILIACVAKDRTGGTEDTIKKYLKSKKGLILV
jgi:hypothetical protein